MKDYSLLLLEPDEAVVYVSVRDDPQRCVYVYRKTLPFAASP